MRTYVLALLAVAGLGLSACGSDSSSHDVVPSTLPDLTAPQGSGALAKPARSGTDTTGGTTSTPSGSTSTPSSGTTGTATQGGTSSGGAAPSGTGQGGTGGAGSGGTASGGTSSGTTTGNTGGASPGEFNQFCQDNPGACPGN